MPKTAAGTGDEPRDPRTQGLHQAEAQWAAFQRIRRDRRRLTQAGAEAIVREEANARGFVLASHMVRDLARRALRSGWWPFLHPQQARRESYRFIRSRDKT